MKFIIKPLVDFAFAKDLCGCLFGDSNCSDCEFKGWEDCDEKSIW